MTITSSTGGRIIEVEGGLVHYGNTERFDFDRQNDVERTELKADWHPLFLTPVVLTGPAGRVVSFK